MLVYSPFTISIALKYGIAFECAILLSQVSTSHLVKSKKEKGSGVKRRRYGTVDERETEAESEADAEPEPQADEPRAAAAAESASHRRASAQGGRPTSPAVRRPSHTPLLSPTAASGIHRHSVKVWSRTALLLFVALISTAAVFSIWGAAAQWGPPMRDGVAPRPSDRAAPGDDFLGYGTSTNLYQTYLPLAVASVDVALVGFAAAIILPTWETSALFIFIAWAVGTGAVYGAVMLAGSSGAVVSLCLSLLSLALWAIIALARFSSTPSHHRRLAPAASTDAEPLLGAALVTTKAKVTRTACLQLAAAATIIVVGTVLSLVLILRQGCALNTVLRTSSSQACPLPVQYDVSAVIASTVAVALLPAATGGKKLAAVELIQRTRLEEARGAAARE